MKIMCSVNYSFKGGVEPCRARVDLLLPRSQWRLHPYFIQERKMMLGEDLDPEWGFPVLIEGEEIRYRYRSEYISGSSWGEVHDKVRRLLRELAVTLSELVEKSAALDKEMPVDEYYILQPEREEWIPTQPFNYIS